MVDLDQCTHATINGCDKEQQGWYPLPSSLSPSICPLLMPITLPPAQLFLSDDRSTASALAPTRPQAHSWCWGAADGMGARCAGCCIHPPPSNLFPGRTLSSLSIRLIMRSLFHLLLACPPQLFSLSFSPAQALSVSHMLISHGCTHSLQPYREISASDPPCPSWTHCLWCRCCPLMTQLCAHLLIPVQVISV